MPENFSEIELRIQSLLVKRTPKTFGEKNYEVKIFSVVSDGVPDRTFNLELGVFSLSEGGRVEFGPNGFALYRNRAGQIPRFLDAHLAVVEDDSNIRNMARLMAEIRKQDDFTALSELLSLATINPALKIGVDVARTLMDIGLAVLESNKDDLWLRQYFTFNYRIDGYEGAFSAETDDVKIDLELVTA